MLNGIHFSCDEPMASPEQKHLSDTILSTSMDPIPILFATILVVFVTYWQKNVLLTLFVIVSILVIALPISPMYILLVGGGLYLVALIAATFQLPSTITLLSLPFFLLLLYFLLRLLRPGSFLTTPSSLEWPKTVFSLFLLYPESFTSLISLHYSLEQALEEEVLSKKEELHRSESYSMQHRIKKMYAHVKHLPTTLDLSSYKRPFVQFFEESSEEQGVSLRYIISAVILFLLINGIVFFNRDSIVGILGSVFWGKASSSRVPAITADEGDQGFLKNLLSFQFLPNSAPSATPANSSPTSVVQQAATITTPTIVVQATAIPIGTIPVVSETISVALLTGSSNSADGRTIERLLEQNRFFVKSIDVTAASEKTIILCKHGQELYAQKAAAILGTSYTVEIQNTLSDSYTFSDIKISLGKHI